jgi:hypothetical protein
MRGSLGPYGLSVAEFLLEMYVSRETPEVVELGADRARRVALTLRHRNRSVELLRTIFVPEEETAFFVYQAESADDVREAARLAALPADRVVESVTQPSTPVLGEEMA